MMKVEGTRATNEVDIATEHKVNLADKSVASPKGLQAPRDSWPDDDVRIGRTASANVRRRLEKKGAWKIVDLGAS